MRKKSVLSVIKKLGKPVFTTHEISVVSGKSLSVVTQSLNNLVREGLIVKIFRGIWREEGVSALSPYDVIPYLFPKQRAYVSFISALHLHGIIEQIPQTITLAATSHAKVIHTTVGVFYAHHITPLFFSGFGWYKRNGNFLIAEPEKALVDCLYLSAYKKKQFSHFPELYFSKSFSFKKVRTWVNKIPSHKVRLCVNKKLQEIVL